MAYFFSLEQMGKGTFEVESLLSYWSRLSDVHGLTVNQLVTEMAAWGECNGFRFPKSLLYGRVLSMCSYGENVHEMTRIVEAATGVTGLGSGTLVGLKEVLAPSGIGALKKHKAWCPRCYQDDEQHNEVCYDRLFWAIGPIERCPIHKLRLLTHCPHCGDLQRYPHSSGSISKCHTCEESLVGLPREWQVDFRPGFAESDISSLIEYLARSDAQSVKKNAFQTYERYASQIRRSKLRVSEEMTGTQGRRVQLPTLHTLLKVAMRDGADIVLMVTNPKEAVRQSSQLANFSLDFAAIHRTRTPELVVDRTREMLEKASTGDGSKSLAAHCREIGVTKGFAQYRFPELCKKVVLRWWARRAAQRRKKIRDAMRLLVDSEWERYLTGIYASQDMLVAEISGKCGCTIRAARLLVAARIRGSTRRHDQNGEIDSPLTRHAQFLLTVAEYAEVFGQKFYSASAKVSYLVKRGRMFTLPASGKRLPRFQFDQKGNPLPIFKFLLNHIRPGVEVDFFEWFLRPHKLLANKRPVDVLRKKADGLLISLVEAEFGTDSKG